MSFSKYIQTSITDYENSDLDFWSRNSTIKSIPLNKIKKRIGEIRSIRSTAKKHNILNDFIEEVMTDLIKNSRHNLRIDNIPDKTANGEAIDYDTLHSTFSEWGKIHILYKYKQSVYIWYYFDSDAEYAHEHLNEMMVVSNIITTEFKKSNLMTTKYDWSSKTKYNIYTFFGTEIQV